MLVVSEDDYEWYSENNIPIDMSLPNIIRVCKEVGCFAIFTAIFYHPPL